MLSLLYPFYPCISHRTPVLSTLFYMLQVDDSLCSGTKPATTNACNGGTHCTFCSGDRAKCTGHGICSNVKGACVCGTGYSVSMPTPQLRSLLQLSTGSPVGLYCIIAAWSEIALWVSVQLFCILLVQCANHEMTLLVNRHVRLICVW